MIYNEENKTVSAALLLETPDGFLFVHPTDKGIGEGCWDLPKGHIEDGETPRQAMKRELKEETGLDYDADIAPYALSVTRDLGRLPYIPSKDIHLFYTKVDRPVTKQMKCTSTFINKYGREIPECDDYMFARSFKYLYPKLQMLLMRLCDLGRLPNIYTKTNK